MRRAKVMPTPSIGERARLKARAKELLRQHDATLVAHYYVDGDLQDLALETGGPNSTIAIIGKGGVPAMLEPGSTGFVPSATRTKPSCSPISATIPCLPIFAIW